MTRWIVRHPLAATLTPLVIFAGTLAALQARRTPPPLDDFGEVGDFAFVAKDGRGVTRADLDGKVWIAACFFCSCTESCPQLSGAMARLQGQLAAESDVRLVSITVDPDLDTADVLARYATAYGADDERWLFLRGAPSQVRDFVQTRLHLAAVPNDDPKAPVSSKVIHSDKLTLIDRKGRIRGYFNGTDAAAVADLKRAAEQLAREPR